MTDLDAIDEHVRPHLDSSALLVMTCRNDFLDADRCGAGHHGGTSPAGRAGGGLPPCAPADRARGPIYDGDDVDPVRRTAVTRDDARIVRPAPRGPDPTPAAPARSP